MIKFYKVKLSVYTKIFAMPMLVSLSYSKSQRNAQADKLVDNVQQYTEKTVEIE